MVPARLFLHGDDQHLALAIADSLIAVRRRGMEKDRIAPFQIFDLPLMGQTEAAGEHIKELCAGMRVGLGLPALRGLQKLGDIGRNAPVDRYMAEAFKVIPGIFHATLRQLLAFIRTENAKQLGPLRLEEITHVLGKDHGDAGEVPQGRHHAPGLQLRQEAGRKACVTTQFDQAHLLALAKVLDAIPDALVFDKGLRNLRIHAALDEDFPTLVEGRNLRSMDRAFRLGTEVEIVIGKGDLVQRSVVRDVQRRQLRVGPIDRLRHLFGHSALLGVERGRRSNGTDQVHPMKDVAVGRKDARRRTHRAGIRLGPWPTKDLGRRRPWPTKDLGPRRPNARLQYMQPPWRVYACVPTLLLSASVVGLMGCASPGPPRPPSLGIPHPVSDLQATRSGDAVELRFSVPNHTTEGLPLRAPTLTGTLCRQLGQNMPCTPVDAAETIRPLTVPTSAPTAPVATMVWTDTLPAGLTVGQPRPIAYRIELRNPAGRSAGFSDPAPAAAGAAPPPVRDLHADPMRWGVHLSWLPAPGAGEVLLRRTQGSLPASLGGAADTSFVHESIGEPVRESVHSKPRAKTPLPHGRSATKQSAAPGPLLLQAALGNASAAATIDAGILEGVPYTYTAIRRVQVQVGGHTLSLESAPSLPVTTTWRDRYPPAAPTGVAALGYKIPRGGTDPSNGDPSNRDPGNGERFAVDLVWQPVIDPRLAGYLVYREALRASGEPQGPRVKLTPQPLAVPGFHDATAKSTERYRYTVTAIDPKANESGAAATIVDPVTP